MTVEEVRAILAEHRPELDELGVETLRVFGSVARGEAAPESDVDLLVTFGARPVGLFRLGGVQRRLSEWLGRSVDLVMDEGTAEPVPAEVLQEAVNAA